MDGRLDVLSKADDISKPYEKEGTTDSEDYSTSDSIDFSGFSAGSCESQYRWTPRPCERGTWNSKGSDIEKTNNQKKDTSDETTSSAQDKSVIEEDPLEREVLSSLDARLEKLKYKQNKSWQGKENITSNLQDGECCVQPNHENSKIYLSDPSGSISPAHDVGWHSTPYKVRAKLRKPYPSTSPIQNSKSNITQLDTLFNMQCGLLDQKLLLGSAVSILQEQVRHLCTLSADKVEESLPVEYSTLGLEKLFSCSHERSHEITNNYS